MVKRIALCLMFISMTFAGVSEAAVTTYATRLAFDLANPGLPIEDFEEAADELVTITDPYLHQYRMEDEEVLDVDTDNVVFHDGDIIEGIQIYSSHGESHRLVVLGVGSYHYGMPIDSVKISGTNDVSRLNLAFPGGVNAVAFDVLYGGSDVGIKVFDADDVLIAGYEFEITSNFFGIYTSDLIFRIEVDAPAGGDGHFEAIDNVAFGFIEPSPEEKMADLLDYFEESIDTGTIGGASRGWYRNIQILADFWKRLRAAEFLIGNDRIRLACEYLRLAEQRASRRLTGDSVPELIDLIHDLREDLGCPRFYTVK